MKKNSQQLLIIGFCSLFLFGTSSPLHATVVATDNAKINIPAARKPLNIKRKVNFQEQKPTPPGDLSTLVGILQNDLNKTQGQAVEIKVSKKVSSKQIRPIQTFQLALQSDKDKNLSLKSTNEKPALLLDSKFGLLLKLFLSNPIIFNTTFSKVEELKFTKKTIEDPNGLTFRKIFLEPIDSLKNLFGTRVIASLDKENHLRALEITDKSGIKIYELSKKPPATQKKPMSTPLKPNLVW